MKNIWNTLHARAQRERRPLYVLAPMADVTDAAFRRIIAKRGMPDAMWTEFVSADGLIRADEIGKKKLMRDLLYTDSERPIVAQLFTSNPEYMKQAAELVAKLGFDAIDINMGCPDRGIERQGAGAALIKTPKIAREVIRAAQTAGLPVSVKTRIGYNKNQLEEWLPELLAENPAVVTIHARTRKEMSKVPARWEHVARAVEIRNGLKSKTLIFGNGDVTDLKDAYIKGTEAKADGVMLGRAIFGNPWLFAGREVGLREKLETMVEHSYLFTELLGDIKNFAIMKKHYKAYVHGFEGAAELRAKLMETVGPKEVEVLVKEFLKTI